MIDIILSEEFLAAAATLVALLIGGSKHPRFGGERFKWLNAVAKGAGSILQKIRK